MTKFIDNRVLNNFGGKIIRQKNKFKINKIEPDKLHMFEKKEKDLT